MKPDIERLGEKIRGAERAVFFGGAGVSTESGIPDFRSAHGLYSGARGGSYEEMLSWRYFIGHQDEFWAFYKSVMLYPEARPNAAHYALSRMEGQGRLRAVLTQNIDGLHQAAGSRNVLELHGTVHGNSCLKCGKRYDLAHVLEHEGTPGCPACGGVLRPDIVMYGEPLDRAVLDGAINEVAACDLLIVGGTSLMVHPAAGLIGYRKPGVDLVLINREATPFDSQAQLVIRDNIARVLAEAVPEV